VARLAVVSFRLGGTDGVSIEAAKWVAALEALGHEITLVAGEGPVDVRVPGLAIGARAPSRARLDAALADADLVIVENLASLPLNPGARDVLYAVLEGRRAIFHHHDLAWQRPATAHLAGPRDAPCWRHVTINDLSRRELAARGIVATTIPNSFDCDPPPGDRDAVRARLDVGDRPVALLATRAIARKNVAGALALARDLDAVLWLLGPSEDDYEEELRALLARSGVTVRRGPHGASIHDAYSACDLVVLSSTWEGFGNPVLESVTHRRPLALYPYPVAREIARHGFAFFDLDDREGLRDELRAPDEGRRARNLAIARRHFNVAHLPARLAALLAQSQIASPLGSTS
jgi:glycosyltransferase involved in cell wall biosynthesis